MAAALAKELRPHGVAAGSLSIGHLRTEGSLANLAGLTESDRSAMLSKLKDHRYVIVTTVTSSDG